jgi:hypothetical protein
MNFIPYRKLTFTGLTGMVGSLFIMLSIMPVWTKNNDELIIGLTASQNVTNLNTTAATTTTKSSPLPTPYHGILINGEFAGTQLYDPFNAPNAHGNLPLGLRTGYGAAVAKAPLVYFGGTRVYG